MTASDPRIKELEKRCARVTASSSPTEAETMLKIFEASIATGFFPKLGSPCHEKLRKIIGMAALSNWELCHAANNKKETNAN